MQALARLRARTALLAALLHLDRHPAPLAAAVFMRRAQECRTAEAVILDNMRMAPGHLASTVFLGGLQVRMGLPGATSVPSAGFQV